MMVIITTLTAAIYTQLYLYPYLNVNCTHFIIPKLFWVAWLINIEKS